MRAGKERDKQRDSVSAREKERERERERAREIENEIENCELQGGGRSARGGDRRKRRAEAELLRPAEEWVIII